MKRKVLHILMSDYSVDSRVKNQTESLIKNYDVTVMCLTSKNKNDKFRNGVVLSRHGLNTKSKIIRVITSYFSMFTSSLFSKIDVVQAHDMNALPLAFIISKIKRIPLIYDSHELWAHSHHGAYNSAIIKAAEKVERFCAQRADQVITVSQSIGRYLESDFKKERVTIIQNVPSYIHMGSYDFFREKYKIEPCTPIFLYQGLITQNRGAKLIVDAILKIKKECKFVFVFLGDGAFVKELKVLIKENQLEDKVKIEGFVPQKDLLKYTASADIGVHALDRSCLNHEYCLPNKVFEYVHAGIGMVCPNLIELERFVESNSLGIVYKSGDSDELAQAIEYLIKNPNEVVKSKESAILAQSKYNWGVEEFKLLKLYSEVINQ